MKPDHSKILKNYRNYWYNDDYLKLLAERFFLSRYKKVLDVGCGLFHWIRTITPYLSPQAEITGLDHRQINPDDLKILSEIEALKDKSVQFQSGDASNLPFPDNSFDLVTCQTLLIHVKDPKKVLSEMYRVLKPGGAVLISEPNNLSNSIFRDSISINANIKERVKTFTARLNSETKKIESGCGDNSIGEVVPFLLKKNGFINIKCYMNDKVSILSPPYETEEQQEKINMLQGLIETYPFALNKDEKREISEMNEKIIDGEYISFTPSMLLISFAIKK